MSEKVNKIIKELEVLSLLESVELVNSIEKLFKINSSNALTESTTIKNITKVEEIEEKTEFNLSLDEVPKNKKIPILKVIRSITGLGLKEVKELVDSAPKIIKESITKTIAEDMKKQIEDAGGKASLQ
uniref:50S ribosomal protein L12 n=1 Tax=Nitzschia alba TaxID=2858 RepID=A0A5C0F3P8_NITAL|nr:50S ribosomal protein L12 [Nitzschia alba]QEI59581.1 50S ribosomal protein L12 [Nitzschia alba]